MLKAQGQWAHEPAKRRHGSSTTTSMSSRLVSPRYFVSLGAQVAALLAEAEELLGNEQYAEGAWRDTEQSR